MGNYHVCVYAICKNEAKFARRWMDSMSEADHIVVLENGHVAEQGTPAEIFGNPQCERLKDFLSKVL